MKIDRAFLESKGACDEGKEWFIYQGITDPVKGLKNLIKHDKLDWANWLIVRVMERKQYLAYAIFAAEQVLDIFEKKYPKEDSPRKAIEAAKAVLANDAPETRKAAAYAASAAYAAAYAAYAAYAAASAAYAAAYDADSAAYAYAYTAYDAAYAAAYAADSAAYAYAYAAASAAYAAKKQMKLRILEYGLKLLQEGKA